MQCLVSSFSFDCRHHGTNHNQGHAGGLWVATLTYMWLGSVVESVAQLPFLWEGSSIASRSTDDDTYVG